MSLLDVILWPFNTPAVTFAGVGTSWGEVTGFVTGALCVWLVARQNSWNWPIGILNNLAFLVLFATGGLYADSGLQVVYIALALYGWWAWLRGGTGRGPLPVSRTTPAQWWWLLGTGVAGTLLIVWVLKSFTTSTVPWADAVTTVLSLLATWGQTRKKVECWWLWIAADVIYVPLYAYKDLWLTAILYLGFIGLCVLGLRNWTRARRADLVAA
ncbi:nicotinamide mononucleotide transporter [Saccharothrix tamanrassetensis]|uniref:Nicotinamide mononucleotide transporter n=1 Tax=Saccharothrix tamanrassetensis TaxID=1051531 RepID=A0A841CTU4_9PSEU|nr:nicotinamide riboside transporter PnuC [Saccharothrix tamanrassetensis]MBB5959457.1 nicotinamide mononucleotide transporter [Saccharothrix tamanrassetensis]